MLTVTSISPPFYCESGIYGFQMRAQIEVFICSSVALAYNRLYSFSAKLKGSYKGEKQVAMYQCGTDYTQMRAIIKSLVEKIRILKFMNATLIPSFNKCCKIQNVCLRDDTNFVNIADNGVRQRWMGRFIM